MMKKVIYITLFALIITSCGGKGSKKAVISERDSLKYDLHVKDSLLNDVFMSLGDITSNLNMIKSRENIVTTAIEESEIAKSPIVGISEDIAAIDQLLLSNHQTIERLEKSTAQLKRANIKVASLENLIAEMTLQVESKDREISSLKKSLATLLVEVDVLTLEVTDLGGKVESLEAHATERDREIYDKNEAMNRVYYIVGERNDLVSKEIVYKSGFIGRTLKVNENRSLDSFTEADLRQLNVIFVGRKNIEIVTPHPADSYSFDMDDNGLYKGIKIVDKERFWSTSKVLVVSYK